MTLAIDAIELLGTESESWSHEKVRVVQPIVIRINRSSGKFVLYMAVGASSATCGGRTSLDSLGGVSRHANVVVGG